MSIKLKLTLLVCVTTGLALLIAAIISFAYNHVQREKSHLNNLDILAEVIAKRSSAALAFNDKRNANENLRALDSQPDILQTCLFKKNGELFTQHISGPVSMGCSMPEVKDNKAIQGDMAVVTRIVWLNDNMPLGVLSIKASIDSVKTALLTDSSVQAVFFTIALVAAFILTMSLQSYIYMPITQLGQAANKVINENDYSVHIDIDSSDEIGTSITAFNSMLSKINIDREKLTQLAYYDALTHLPNRRRLWDDAETLLEQLAQNTEKTEPKYFLTLMDMDNFKLVNDSLGHESGDTLLVNCANVLIGLQRQGIQSYRLAGDEFVTVLETHEEADVANYASSVLHKVALRSARIATPKPVTFSIGISKITSGDTISEALHRADMALYTAKAQGRNQYVLSAEDFPEQESPWADNSAT